MFNGKCCNCESLVKTYVPYVCRCKMRKIGFGCIFVVQLAFLLRSIYVAEKRQIHWKNIFLVFFLAFCIYFVVDLLAVCRWLWNVEKRQKIVYNLIATHKAWYLFLVHRQVKLCAICQSVLPIWMAELFSSKSITGAPNKKKGISRQLCIRISA